MGKAAGLFVAGVLKVGQEQESLAKQLATVSRERDGLAAGITQLKGERDELTVNLARAAGKRSEESALIPRGMRVFRLAPGGGGMRQR